MELNMGPRATARCWHVEKWAWLVSATGSVVPVVGKGSLLGTHTQTIQAHPVRLQMSDPKQKRAPTLFRGLETVNFLRPEGFERQPPPLHTAPGRAPYGARRINHGRPIVQTPHPFTWPHINLDTREAPKLVGTRPAPETFFVTRRYIYPDVETSLTPILQARGNDRPVLSRSPNRLGPPTGGRKLDFLLPEPSAPSSLRSFTPPPNVRRSRFLPVARVQRLTDAVSRARLVVLSRAGLIMFHPAVSNDRGCALRAKLGTGRR